MKVKDVMTKDPFTIDPEAGHHHRAPSRQPSRRRHRCLRSVTCCGRSGEEAAPYSSLQRASSGREVCHGSE